MLVRLTEVCQNNTDNKARRLHTKRGFVNPEHVVMIREAKTSRD